MAPHNVYRCKGTDRWCAIAISNEEEWKSLKKAIGRPEWAEQTIYSTMEQRKKHEEKLDEKISSWTSSRKAYEIMDLLQNHGVAAGVVQDTKDLLTRDTSFTKTHVIDMAHPEVDSMKIHGETISISDVESKFDRAPLLGEHNDFVLGELLGIDESEIDDLYVSGVLR
jgi:crotonobetainyl-CoA:carnitine CoA-transferase CaiB-like acyl-CoA transferase